MVLTAFLVTIFAYGLISRRAERTLLSAPLIVTAAGLALGSLLGRRGLEVDAADVLFIGELALAAMLFTSASAIRFRTLIGDRWLPLRLLVIADPLIVAFGAAFAVLLLEQLTLIEACIVGTLLAPSAANAVVVRNDVVPARIRRALGVESGLDGLTVPLVTLYGRCVARLGADAPENRDATHAPVTRRELESQASRVNPGPTSPTPE